MRPATRAAMPSFWPLETLDIALILSIFVERGFVCQVRGYNIAVVGFEAFRRVTASKWLEGVGHVLQRSEGKLEGMVVGSCKGVTWISN